MKKILLPFLICFIFSFNLTKGQIICIQCFDQNDSISSGVNNLLLNGSFENSPCIPWPGSFHSYCPNSQYFDCSIADWTCTGGGIGTYAVLFDGTSAGFVPDGIRSVYFGNGFCDACSFINDTSCLADSGCAATGILPGHPLNQPDYGGTTGVNLYQTVNGLSPGNAYVLEFWSGGEGSPYVNEGLFAVDIGFGYTYLRCPSTNPITGVGRRYIIEFYATSTSHTIKFTSWGHISNNSTELILDDAKLYTLAELSGTVAPCLVTPVAMFTAVSPICPGTCTNFTNLSQNTSSYIWSFPGATPAVSTDVNPTSICYNSPGNYDVTLIASNGTSSDTLTLANYVTVYPYPPPQGISQSGDSLIAVAGAVSYQWFYNGNIIPGATDYYYVAAESGNYNVVATDQNDCEVEAVIFDVVAGIDNHAEDDKIFIRQNPVDQLLEITNPDHQSSVVIYNTLGESLFRSSTVTGSIPCGSFVRGVYILEIISGNKIMRTKFIIK